MKYLPMILVALILASCAVVPAFDVPACSSPESAGELVDRNVKYDDSDNIIASPSETSSSGLGNCIEKSLLCLAMVKQSLGIDGELVLYSTQYGDHATARFDGYEYGYIQDSRQIGRAFSYRDAMGLIGKSNNLMVW